MDVYLLFIRSVKYENIYELSNFILRGRGGYLETNLKKDTYTFNYIFKYFDYQDQDYSFLTKQKLLTQILNIQKYIVSESFDSFIEILKITLWCTDVLEFLMKILCMCSDYNDNRN